MACDVSVIIPVFNDADALPELLQRLEAAMSGGGRTLEIIIVDDASSMPVWEQITSLPAAFPNLDLTLVRLAANCGQHPATVQGLLQASGAMLVTMDADLQHAPEFVPQLLEALTSSQADVMYAISRGGHTLFRRLLSAGRRLLVSPIGSSLGYASPFRAINRSTVDALIRPAAARIVNLDEFLSWTPIAIQWVGAPHFTRKYNRSTYTLWRLIKYALVSAWHTRHLSRALGVLGIFLLVASVAGFRSSEPGLQDLASELVFAGVGVIFLALCHRVIWQFGQPARHVRIEAIIHRRR